MSWQWAQNPGGVSPGGKAGSWILGQEMLNAKVGTVVKLWAGAVRAELPSFPTCLAAAWLMRA